MPIRIVPRAPGGNGVDFVEEDDGGSELTRVVKERAKPFFGLSHPLAVEFGSLHRGKMGVHLVGDGPGQQRLSATRRPVEDDTLVRCDPQVLHQLRMPNGQLDDLPDLCHDLVHPTNVLEGDNGDLPLLFRCSVGLWISGHR